MESLLLGRLVNTDRYTTESLESAIAKWNALPEPYRRGEDFWSGYPKPSEYGGHTEWRSRIQTIDIQNVIAFNLTIVEHDGRWCLFGQLTKRAAILLPTLPVYGFGIRGEYVHALGQETLERIITVDLVGKTDEVDPTVISLKGIKRG